MKLNIGISNSKSKVSTILSYKDGDENVMTYFKITIISNLLKSRINFHKESILIFLIIKKCLIF